MYSFFTKIYQDFFITFQGSYAHSPGPQIILKWLKLCMYTSIFLLHSCFLSNSPFMPATRANKSQNYCYRNSCLVQCFLLRLIFIMGSGTHEEYTAGQALDGRSYQGLSRFLDPFQMRRLIVQTSLGRKPPPSVSANFNLANSFKKLNLAKSE